VTTKHDDKSAGQHGAQAPDEKRPLRTDLAENRPENRNPAESRPVLSHATEPPGPDKDVAGINPSSWPAHTFDATGQVGAPGELPVAHGVVPVPPEPGGRDPAVEKLLREGIHGEDPRDLQAHPTTPGDPPGRMDAAELRRAQEHDKRALIPPAPGPEAKQDHGGGPQPKGDKK
jgi:hypothetical protein